MIDVFGGDGFLTKATNLLGLRGYVLDTKFGSRCDVTQPNVFQNSTTSPLENVSQEGFSPPRQHTSCPSNVISANAAIANLLHRARTLWILEHPCDSWLWDVQRIEALAAQPRTA